MTHFRRFLLTAASFFLLVNALSAQEISITDFRIPESRYNAMMLSLNGNLSSNRSGGDPTSTSSNFVRNLQFMSSHSLGFNSEDLNYYLMTFVNGSTSRGENQNDRSNVTPKRIRNINFNEGLNINYNGEYSRYITPDEIFWFTGSNGNGSYSFNRYFDEWDGAAQPVTFNKTQNYAVSLSAGIGYGKTRNARSVIVVLRILEKLTEDGYLTRELSQSETMALAEKYEAALTNNYEHSRPTKYIVRTIFDDLLEKGLITTEKVIAYATERTAEVFQEEIYPRLFGWTVQAGPNIYRTEQLWFSQNAYKWNAREGGNDLMIKGTYGYPFSTQLHWTSGATVLVPFYGRQNRVDYSFSTTLYYEVSERISAECSANLYRSNYYTDGSVSNDGRFYFSNYLHLSSEFNYYIEDHLSFFVRGNFYDNVQRMESKAYSYKNINDYYSVTFGVNYKVF